MRLTYVLAAATLWGCSTPPPTALHATACWIEYSAGDAPSSLVAPDLPNHVWHTTTSGLLLRRPDGDLLIDAGWSSAAAEQSAELTEEGRSWSLRILSAVAWRRSTPVALAASGVDARDLDWILPTHAHYDHMAGAQDIPGAPIHLTRQELDFLTAQLSLPSIIAPSNIRALQERFVPITFDDGAYMGFPESYDFFGGGEVVVVPLPGHTPGSVGVFASVRDQRVLMIGDAALMTEAAERGLRKIDPLRTALETSPEESDRTVAQLAAFHARHPDVTIIPAHDRTAWQAAFGEAPGCISG